MTARSSPDRDFLVIGESLIDLIAEPEPGTFTAHPGGSPFNVAVGLARLGRPVTLATEFGDDHFGRLIDLRLRHDGVAVRRRTEPTSIAIAALDPAGSAEYDFRFSWRLDADTVGPIEAAACVHTGSLACVVEPGATEVLAAVRAARRRGVTISFDPNVRPSLAPERRVATAMVEEFVAEATIIKASIEDMTWLYPDVEPIESCQRWAAGDDRLVVLTQGADGCVGMTSKNVVTVPAQRVPLADTVGAGDSFIAALLAHLQVHDALAAPARLDLDAMRDALEFATWAAAITCEHVGAYSPTADEIQHRREH